MPYFHQQLSLHRDFLHQGKVARIVDLNNKLISEFYKANKKFNFSYVDILNTQNYIFLLSRSDRLEETENTFVVAFLRNTELLIDLVMDD